MKFYPLVTYLLLRMEKSLKFRRSKGNNCPITDDTLIKLHVHNLTIAIYIYIQLKFHVITSIGYLVMAEDRNLKKNFCKQTVENLIRCRNLRRLIWFYTVCQCPTKRALSLYELYKKTALYFQIEALGDIHICPVWL